VFERLLSFAYVFPFRCEACHRRFRAFRWRERWTRILVERRAHERTATDMTGTLWMGDVPLSGRVVDLSMGGLAFETTTPMAEGEVIQLKLDPESGKTIMVDEAVVRSSTPRRVGVQFVKIQQDEEGRLRQYLYEVSISRLE
jgi:c-di-GMP-binding flagellar brake protein YcgR